MNTRQPIFASAILAGAIAALTSTSLLPDTAAASATPILYSAGDTAPGGKIAVTYDTAEPGKIKSLVATPADGETLEVSGDAMAFAANATISMAADGKLVFGNDVAADGKLSLTRTDGGFYAHSLTGTLPLSSGGDALTGKTSGEWEVFSAFANAKGTRASTSTGAYERVRSLYGTTDGKDYGIFVLNRWDGEYTHSARIQLLDTSNGNSSLRLLTVISMPHRERWPTNDLWATGSKFPPRLRNGEGRIYCTTANIQGELKDYASVWGGAVTSNGIDRIVLRRTGSDVATVAFAGDVALGGATDIALGVKLAVLPKAGSVFTAPVFTGEGDVECQRDSTLASANRMKYGANLVITNGAQVSVTHAGGFPTNGVVSVWSDSALTLAVASDLATTQGISDGMPDIRAKPGSQVIVNGTLKGMFKPGGKQLIEFDNAEFWTNTDKVHRETSEHKENFRYINRLALVNGSTIDGSMVRVGNTATVAPCWMVKGSLPSTVGCHVWLFNSGSKGVQTFTLDVDDIEGHEYDCVFNGDILQGRVSGVNWPAPVVKTGNGTLLMNGKIAMVKPLQVNGGALVFGDNGGPAEGPDSITASLDVDLNATSTAARNEVTTSTDKRVLLNGATLGKTAGSLDLGALTVTGGGTLELGPSATMSFADSSAQEWTGRLTINGFRENAVRFGTSADGLAAAQVESIRTGEGRRLHIFANGYLGYHAFTLILR